MTAFILRLDDPFAADPERVGPKAANLAALTHAGLPTPGGFALTADAYRHQLRHLGIEDLLSQYNDADAPTSRRISIQVRLALYERDIAPEILDPLLAAWRKQRETAPLGVVRSSALIEDRAGANFAGQFESFLGLSDETEFLTAIRACWAALCARRSATQEMKRKTPACAITLVITIIPSSSTSVSQEMASR